MCFLQQFLTLLMREREGERGREYSEERGSWFLVHTCKPRAGLAAGKDYPNIYTSPTDCHYHSSKIARPRFVARASLTELKA